MSEQEKQTQEILEMLSVLEPGAGDASRPASQALTQLQRRLDSAEPERPSWSTWLRQWLWAPTRRYATALTVVIALLVITFSFPAVRAAASEFLGLFRVQKFAAISVSPEQIAMLDQLAESGISPGEFYIETEPGALTLVDTLAEAEAATGMTAVRTLAALDDPTDIYVADGGTGRLTINAANSRQLMELAGVDPELLPLSVDGKRINVILFAGVQQTWVDGTVLLQTESPVVQYPEELDPAVLGEALLRVLGLNQLQARRLARQIDWTSTLLLPIPETAASFNEVTVDGVSGIAVTNLDGSESALVWQKDGVVHLLRGSQSAEALLQLAQSLR